MWLFGKKTDLLTLFLPIWTCWVILLGLPTEVIDADIPLWVWVLFVMGIDVGHVWSTIFRTYLDKEEFARHHQVLILAPLISFALALSLAWYSVLWFWRCLAYLAVFHFIKQQYGFLALYKAKAKDFRIQKLFSDKFIIYYTTLYPVFYWHLLEEANFSWFVSGDFFFWGDFFALGASLISLLHLLYWIILAAWVAEEVHRSEQIHWGKILWVITTAINWYGGIVFFNSDLIFTVSSVVAHGIPYLALMIYYQHQKEQIQRAKKTSVYYWIALIFPVVMLLAWIEEYCWDRWVYNDRPDFFGAIIPYADSLLEDPFAKGFAIALLTIPQMTHYIIDGFIWKSNKHNPYIKQVFK